jgi:hypothetical protein
MAVLGADGQAAAAADGDRDERERRAEGDIDPAAAMGASSANAARLPFIFQLPTTSLRRRCIDYPSGGQSETRR